MNHSKGFTTPTIFLFFLFVLLIPSCDNDQGSESAQPENPPLGTFIANPSPSPSKNILFPSPSATKVQLNSPTPIYTPELIILTSTPSAPTIPTPTPAALPGAIYRINLSSMEVEANDTSEGVSINANGNVIAFVSIANNLVENDKDGDCLSISGKLKSCTDVFVKDLGTGEIMLISKSNNGSLGNAHSGIVHEWGAHTSISSDGRYIVFHSNANNFVPDTNSTSSYLFDKELNQIQLIDKNSIPLETGTYFYSINPVISASGEFVVFQSNKPNLIDNDSNGVDDIFLYDVQTEQTERINIGAREEQANRASGLGYPATISEDGRFVAFVSDATNLIPNDANNLPDIFLRDRVLQETIRISTNNSDEDLGASNGASTNPILSKDGQFIVFQSAANNLIQNDTNDAIDIFLYHLATGHLEIVSVGWNGDLANGSSGNPDISSNNRWIAFSSDADNLVPHDTNNVTDIFIYDTVTGHTIRASVDNDGKEGNHISNSPAISGDGSKIGFVSLASNLVPNDSNEKWDIFIREIDLVWDNP